MSDQRDGGISWTDHTWNPVRGCSRVSPGCTNCYAESVAARFSGPGLPYEGLARRSKNGEPRWTGEVRLVPEHLADPLRWKRPRRIFVNSMSDLFHEKLTNEEIAAVFGVMAAAPHHTFQVLTKRAERMRDWFAWVAQQDPEPWTHCHAEALAAEARLNGDLDGVIHRRSGGDDARRWPLPNVWLGVSAEDQQRADERIPLLLQTPAAVRFVSAEPLLGPIDFRPIMYRDACRACSGRGTCVVCEAGKVDRSALDGLSWVIVGGESGPGARPMDLAWARSILEQCKAAGVAAFFKQAGAVVHWDGVTKPGQAWPAGTTAEDTGLGIFRRLLRDKKGGNLNELPADLNVRQFPTTERR